MKQKLFATCNPGLEPILENELTGLGYKVKSFKGGAEIKGRERDIYKLNVQSRIAGRILLRLGSFHATTFQELKRRVVQHDWEPYLSLHMPVAFHITCHKSKLFHTDAIEERISDALGAHLGSTLKLAGPNRPIEAAAPQLIIVRMVHDTCHISVDTSGELLHKRGYRQATTRAVLRETLAASLIQFSGWNQKSPLVDPFCGSGTILIEGAQQAAGVLPFQTREFAFMKWPGFNRGLWASIKHICETEVEKSSPEIIGSDRDPGAIKRAIENASRAKVPESVQFDQKSISDLELPSTPGWIITNPPYGVRLKGGKDLRNLYARFGALLKEKAAGWHVCILCSEDKLLGQTGLKFDKSISFDNGGLSVKMSVAKID